MDTMHRRPEHLSYRKHRRQTAWQIIVPMVVAGLIMIGMVYLLVVGTFQGGGDSARWAAISTMWLTIPFMIGALVLLVLVAGMAYLIGRLAGLIPRYSRPAQIAAMKMEAGARRAGEIGHHPKMIIPELGKLVRYAFNRIRGH